MSEVSTKGHVGKGVGNTEAEEREGARWRGGEGCQRLSGGSKGGNM